MYCRGIGLIVMFLLQASLIMDCRRSAASTKSSGDRGSPCLSPLLQWNTLPGTPFSRTDDVPELMMSLIQEIHFISKPFSF